MAPSEDADADADAALSDPLTEETTATKRQRLNSSTETPTSPSSSSSSTIPTLPFETVAEILSRLPVKLLMQLQSVCKSWKSLISDPKFIKKHLRVSTTRPHLVLAFTNSSRKFALTAYPLSSFFSTATATATATATDLEYPLNNRIRNRNRFDLIVGSCHGIFCFALGQRFALLWNPSIKKFTKSPSLDNPKRDGSYTIYGFGHDHVNDIYKVVAVNCFESDNGGYKTQVKVHTLGTNFWRRIQDFPFGVPFDESGKFISGTVNWLAFTDSSYNSLVIVSLDLEKETYQELLQPDYGAVNVVTTTLAVLRDRLCILAHSNTFSDVWLMQEYGNRETWTKLFRVPYMGNVGCCPYTRALYVTEDDQVLLEYQLEMVVYNSRDDTFKTLEFPNIKSLMVLEVYQDSLVSPCS